LQGCYPVRVPLADARIDSGSPSSSRNERATHPCGKQRLIADAQVQASTQLHAENVRTLVNVERIAPSSSQRKRVVVVTADVELAESNALDV
jgi:hypothetical protein